MLVGKNPIPCNTAVSYLFITKAKAIEAYENNNCPLTRESKGNALKIVLNQEKEVV